METASETSESWRPGLSHQLHAPKNEPTSTLMKLNQRTHGSNNILSKLTANCTHYLPATRFVRIWTLFVVGILNAPLAIPLQATKPAPPLAPSNLSATAVSSSQINLTWRDNSSNESGFSIE